MKFNKMFPIDKIFAAVILIILNIGSKNVDLTLSPAQKHIFKHPLTKQLLIFSIAWVGSRDIKTALLVTCIYILIVDVAMNSKSRLNLLPESLRKLEASLDINRDGKIDEEELNSAIKLLEKIKNKDNI